MTLGCVHTSGFSKNGPSPVSFTLYYRLFNTVLGILQLMVVNDIANEWI